nr:carboxypeptidase-like regulatory domain-containing protein [Gemmatimonadaceae bacterium]
FRPNTVYSITLAPGVADLRGNAIDSVTTLVFSTGPTIPTSSIGGVVFEWAEGKGAPKAVVEAIAPDSTAYITVADSIGRFRLASVPPGSYVLRAFVDGNNDRTVQPRESFDTVRVQLTDSVVTDLYAFVHDTLPVRIASVTPDDSLRVLKVTFDKPLAIDDTLNRTRFTLKRADSTIVPIRLVRTTAEEERARIARDSVRKDSVARVEQEKRRAAGLPPIDSAAIRRAQDSVIARRDSIDRARRLAAARQPARPGARPAPVIDTTPPPKPTRPIPATEIFITLDTTLEAGKGYRLLAGTLRGLSGRGRPAERAFATPRAKVDSTARDSAAAAGRRPPAQPSATPAATPAAPARTPATPAPASRDSVARPAVPDTVKKKPPAGWR